MQNQEVIIRNPMALNEDALAEVFTDHTSDQLEDEALDEIPATDIHTTSK
jgi:hypothetical protein